MNTVLFLLLCFTSAGWVCEYQMRRDDLRYIQRLRRSNSELVDTVLKLKKRL